MSIPTRASALVAISALAISSWLAAQSNSAAGQTAPAAPAVVFSKPDRIRYDDKSLLIDGKPVFIYSGAFHYFRCPPELWKDRFTRMKEAGLNCVETYLAWNYHEPDDERRRLARPMAPQARPGTNPCQDRRDDNQRDANGRRG